MRQTFVFGIPTLLLFLVIQILGSLLLWLSYLPMATQAHAASCQPPRHVPGKTHHRHGGPHGAYGEGRRYRPRRDRWL